ncbi:Lrp/AsnC family transcriptional regulator [Brevundimonas fontaquae]|uniref:Lrp/AsnC family transcriptional regulator n=1 Tax=Brevundimonas fontaquae TaxID=2813778 RepID=A0ABX7LR44_9CAUL|nr:Lrp/AsnC family transcriptional regulator [Brevundimonas fontaquae]QSF54787.1 Lrp/AsnC family transcriptional regulator [Brevundimonas fontaquae]
MSRSTLDDIDRRIIDLLIEDCRMSLRAIGADVGLTAPAVRDRILRLEDTGVIEAFSVRLNARALGFVLEAILTVEPLPGKLAAVEQVLREIPEVVDCVVVTGEACFVSRFVLKDVSDLDRLLGPLHDIARTRTSIVHRKPIPPRRPPF